MHNSIFSRNKINCGKDGNNGEWNKVFHSTFITSIPVNEKAPPELLEGLYLQIAPIYPALNYSRVSSVKLQIHP